jgi:hypothetical protein
MAAMFPSTAQVTGVGPFRLIEGGNSSLEHPPDAAFEPTEVPSQIPPFPMIAVAKIRPRQSQGRNIFTFAGVFKFVEIFRARQTHQTLGIA